MLNYLKYFFNLGHLFSLRPPLMESRAITILFWVFIGLIIVAIVSRLRKPADILIAKGFRRLSHAFLTVGILGLIYLFFAWQGAVIISARFWLLILGLTLALWLGSIGRYLLVEAPKRRTEINRKREFQRYLP